MGTRPWRCAGLHPAQSVATPKRQAEGVNRPIGLGIRLGWGYRTDVDRRKELVRHAYEETGPAFAAARRSAGAKAPWLERFMIALLSGAPVVDLGCGNGEPIARTLAEAGFAVTGIDFSMEQVRRAIAHVPSGRLLVADMATVELEPGGFCGVIAWDSMFHVPAIESIRNSSARRQKGVTHRRKLCRATFSPVSSRRDPLGGKQGIWTVGGHIADSPRSRQRTLGAVLHRKLQLLRRLRILAQRRCLRQPVPGLPVPSQSVPSQSVPGQ